MISCPKQFKQNNNAKKGRGGGGGRFRRRLRHIPDHYEVSTI